MLTRWNDFGTGFGVANELRRRMERLFEDFDVESPFATATVWPRVNLYDTGNALLIQALVPGLSEKDIQLNCTADGISIRGERQVHVPENYATHRRERSGLRFARSFAFPFKVDLERSAASVKNGVLTVTLPKAPEAQPRQITVKAG